ncbi:MAG: LamG-like jellyroll fold domain-containing protein [Bacteroidota bacterium]|nr:LamG-like jellyroll fold domain-containing protein [Bacteroidota bacterium]
MKKIIICILFSLLTGRAGFAQSSFGNVEPNGFNYQNGSITSMKTFHGKLYVTMGHTEASIYRSAIGDAGTFAGVYNPVGYSATSHLVVSNEGSGYLFASVDAPFGGGARHGQNILGAPSNRSKIVRTMDGVNWEDYYELPLSGQSSAIVASSINVFKGTGAVDSVYISFLDEFGNGHVIRNAVDANDFANSSAWQEVCNFNTLFGATGQITSTVVFGGKLYYTINNRMFETADGVNFTENTNFYTSMGGGSLSQNIQVLSMAVYGPDLYLGTQTFNANGAQLWKTNDGIVFDSLFAITGFEEIRNLTAVGAKLWMFTNIGGDFKVGSYDGVSYTVEDSTEFGATGLEIQPNAAIEEFDNHLYIGCKQYDGGGKRMANNPHNQILDFGSSGGQIWRKCLLGPLPNIAIISGADTSVCEGTSATLVASPGFPSYLWNNGNTSQFLSTTIPGFHAVSVVDVNGCRNSAGASIYTITTAPVLFSDSSSVSFYSGITVCKNDTSFKLKAHPESDVNALAYYGQSKGLITPLSTAFASRQLTIEMWVKPDNNTGVIMTQYDTTVWANNNHDIIEYYGGTLYFELPGVSEMYVGTIAPNQWSHIVVQFDGNNFTGYVNGVQAGTGAGVWELPPSGADGFKIGYPSAVSDYGPSPNNTGFIRDVRIWNSVRTIADINTNMNGLLPGVYPDLIYHYELQEGSGVIAYDSSMYVNDATVTGIFVSPQVVTISPVAGTIDYGNNFFEFHPLQTTVYTATYTSIMGCNATSTFTVTVPFVNFAGSNTAVCGGLDANIYMATPGSYTITPGVIDLNPNFTPSPQPVVPTWYYASGFSADGGCAINDSILINVGPAFNSNVGNPPPIFACEETDVTVDVMASGGTAPYTFYWQKNGSTYIDTNYVDSLTFYLGGLAEIVTATGIDAIGCPMNPPVTFTVSPTLSSDLRGHVSTPPPSSLNVDEGLVYVFKHQPGYAGFDTVGYTNLDANGDYFFSPLYAGNYLIKVLPTESAFPFAVPTYYGNAFQWDSSMVYVHGCAQVDTANIQVVESDTTTGTASISGYILEGDGFGNNRYGNIGNPNMPFAPGGPLKGVDVKLGKNPGGGIQARTMSDSTGYYVFDSVPNGGYKIYVDIPNLPMDSTRELTILIGDSSIQNNYFADSASIYINPDTISSVGIYSSDLKYANKFSIYPNPAKDVLYVSYELEKEGKVAFEITNVFGQVIKYEQARKHPEGKNIFIFNIDQLNLQGGVYFISILNDNKKYTQRVVVIE